MRASAVVVVIAALAVGALGAGCAENVNIKVDAPHTQVLLDGTDIGPVGDEGADIQVRPGWKPVAYEVRNGDAQPAVGAIPRTETVWWLVALGAGGALCCVPAAAGAGFCIANPALIGAPAIVLLTGDVSAVASTCAAPSWFSLPVMATCSAVGMAPLGLAFFGENVPPKIVIRPPGSSHSSSPLMSPGTAPPKVAENEMRY